MFPPREDSLFLTTYHTTSCVQDSQVPSYLPYSHQNMAQLIALLITLLQSSPALKPSGPGWKSPFIRHLLKHESPLAQHLLRSLRGVAAFSPTLLHSLFTSFVVLPPFSLKQFSLFGTSGLSSIVLLLCCSHLRNGSLACRDFHSWSITSETTPIMLPVPLSV